MSAVLLLGLYLGAVPVPADAPLLSAQETPPCPKASLHTACTVEVTGGLTLMDAQMVDYLDAERTESKLFVSLGVLSLASGAAALAASDRDFLRGASLPVMGIGLIQLVVGGSVWWRTETQKAHLHSLLFEDPGRYVSEESARMKIVNDNFEIYRWAEIGLLGSGVATAVIGSEFKKDFVTGVGVGLAFQSAVMLALDYFAERRGREYARHVAGFQF